MTSIVRVFPVARRRLWRQVQTSTSSLENPLLAKLLGSSESSVRLALDSMEGSSAQRAPSFWEHLVVSLGSSSPRKARLVLEWRIEKLLHEAVREQDHYLKLISCCGKLCDIGLAMKIFTSMENHGIKLNTGIFNALLTVCSSTGNLIMALSLFEIMEGMENCEANLGTYNTLISMYSKLRDSQGMVSWYLASKRAGFCPDIQTYESLISGFIGSGNFDDADKFYKEMLSSGILPNLAILNMILEGLCIRKNTKGVKEFVKYVTDGGWEFDQTFSEKLVDLYLEMRMVEELEELLDLMKPSTKLEFLSRIHCGIITLYALSNSLDDMEYSVGRMLKGGFMFTSPNVVEAVVCAYFRQNAFTRLDLFLASISGSYKLSRSTYDILVAGYRRSELHDRLDSVVNEMKIAGFA